jgi:hypothetical protein
MSRALPFSRMTSCCQASGTAGPELERPSSLVTLHIQCLLLAPQAKDNATPPVALAVSNSLHYCPQLEHRTLQRAHD